MRHEKEKLSQVTDLRAPVFYSELKEELKERTLRKKQHCVIQGFFFFPGNFLVSKNSPLQGLREGALRKSKYIFPVAKNS